MSKVPDQDHDLRQEPATEAALQSALTLVRESGYVAFKAPPCKYPGGHGRHSLITRTISCEGVEPIPHGFHGTHMGSFGWWVHCQCGHAFADYTA